MNITKLLIIDVALVAVGMPLLFIFQNKSFKQLLSGSPSAENSQSYPSGNLPDQERLISLEKIAQKNGSGINFESLIGSWRFHSVWKQKEDKEDLISSSLLRFFSAKLELNKNGSDKFAITNSIKFGLLIIQFSGIGTLRGNQPLLPFFFDSIELKANSTILISRSLEAPEEKKRPFFALISMGENGRWLSARGRGGGLALWLKE